jgi:hypothetical protein
VTLNRVESLWVTFAFALVLASVHLLAPAIRKLPVVPRHAATSFGGGLAAAYVFLYLLPRLSEGNQAVAGVLHERVSPTPLGNLLVFLVALLGFFIAYALERLTLRSEDDQEAPEVEAEEVAAYDRPEASRPVFALQLAFFAGYSALITYTLPTKIGAGLVPALLFAVAMAMHLVATDQVLQERFHTRLTGRTRLVLAIGAMSGWLVGVLFGGGSTVLINLLTAFLSGAILFNVVNDELPPHRHSSFTWFSLGLVVYGALLTAATYSLKLGAA